MRSTSSPSAEPGNLALLERLWTDPNGARPKDTPDSVTEAAAARFSQIALGLHERGEDPAAAAHFIMQMSSASSPRTSASCPTVSSRR